MSNKTIRLMLKDLVQEIDFNLYQEVVDDEELWYKLTKIVKEYIDD